jgi:hypothetical protein
MRSAPTGRSALQAIAGGTLAFSLVLTVFMIYVAKFRVRRLPPQMRNALQAFSPSLNWSTKWWLAPDFGTVALPRATKRCPLCFFRPMRGNGTSSLSDVTITVALGDIHGLPTTIRSVRSAGLESALVVLADSAAATIIRDSISEIISSCGVLVVDVGRVDEAELGPAWRAKWHLAADFLRVTAYRFQRFVFFNAHDTFFQGDPFLPGVDPEKLFFASEAGRIDPKQVPKTWVSAFVGVLGNQNLNHSLIAPSPVLGGVRPLLAFCALLLRLQSWAQAEQLSITLAILSRSVAQAGIDYRVVPFCGFTASVVFMDKRFAPIYDANGYITCPGSSTTPSVISHYARHGRSIGAHVRAVCAQGDIEWAFKNEQIS